MIKYDMYYFIICSGWYIFPVAPESVKILKNAQRACSCAPGFGWWTVGLPGISSRLCGHLRMARSPQWKNWFCADIDCQLFSWILMILMGPMMINHQIWGYPIFRQNHMVEGQWSVAEGFWMQKTGRLGLCPPAASVDLLSTEIVELNRIPSGKLT